MAAEHKQQSIHSVNKKLKQFSLHSDLVECQDRGPHRRDGVREEREREKKRKRVRERERELELGLGIELKLEREEKEN